MSEAMPQPVKDEAVDDSFVRLAEGGFDNLVAPEAPVDKSETAAPVAETTIETPATREAAIAQVRENLTRHAEATPVAIREENAVDTNKMEQRETIKRSQEEKLFESIGISKTGRTGSKDLILGTKKTPDQEAIRSALTGEKYADNDRRKNAFYTGIGASMVGVVGMGGALMAGATETFAALGGATIGEAGLALGVGGIVLGGITYAGLTVWDAIKRSRHAAEYKKIYGREYNQFRR